MKLATRGIHHLALNTDDMRTTVDFYSKVVGMPLVHAMKVPPGLGTGPGNRGNPPYERIRHYFFDMGNDSLLAFFEMPRVALMPCPFSGRARWPRLSPPAIRPRWLPRPRRSSCCAYLSARAHRRAASCRRPRR